MTEEATRMIERRIRREHCRKQGYFIEENDEERKAREQRQPYQGEDADKQLPTGRMKTKTPAEFKAMMDADAMRRAEVVAMAQVGATARDIADKLGMSMERIHAICRRKGVPIAYGQWLRNGNEVRVCKSQGKGVKPYRSSHVRITTMMLRRAGLESETSLAVVYAEGSITITRKAK